jgi:hypothetical protein
MQIYYQTNLSCPMGRQTMFAARAIKHHTRRALCRSLSLSPGTVSSASSQAEKWSKNPCTRLCLGPSTCNTWVRSQPLLRYHSASRVPNGARLLFAERSLLSTTQFRASPLPTPYRTHDSRSASLFSSTPRHLTDSTPQPAQTETETNSHV